MFFKSVQSASLSTSACFYFSLHSNVSTSFLLTMAAMAGAISSQCKFATSICQFIIQFSSLASHSWWWLLGLVSIQNSWQNLKRGIVLNGSISRSVRGPQYQWMWMVEHTLRQLLLQSGAFCLARALFGLGTAAAIANSSRKAWPSQGGLHVAYWQWGNICF